MAAIVPAFDSFRNRRSHTRWPFPSIMIRTVAEHMAVWVSTVTLTQLLSHNLGLKWKFGRSSTVRSEINHENFKLFIINTKIKFKIKINYRTNYSHKIRIVQLTIPLPLQTVKCLIVFSNTKNFKKSFEYYFKSVIHCTSARRDLSFKHLKSDALLLYAIVLWMQLNV